MEESSRPYDLAFYNQIEEAYQKVVYTHTTQVIHAGRFYKPYKMLKWGQLILSAISTGGFTGTPISYQIVLTQVGGICSTAFLIQTAYFKDIDLSAFTSSI